MNPIGTNDGVHVILVENGRVEIITTPHTDLWQRTYYHFRNDNAPVFQMESEEK